MNRRDFVKALAGVPLLGFLAKLPKTNEGLNLTGPSDPGYVDVTLYSAAFDELKAGAELQPVWELTTAAAEGLNISVPSELGYMDVWDSKTGRVLASGPIEADDWLVMKYQDDDDNWRTEVIFGSPPTGLDLGEDGYEIDA